MNTWDNLSKDQIETYAPITRKICPIISDSETPKTCVTSCCSWWDSKYGRCAVLSQACKK